MDLNSPDEPGRSPGPTLAELLVEVAPFGMVLLDRGGTAVRVNPAARTMLGSAAPDVAVWAETEIATVLVRVGLPDLAAHGRWRSAVSLPAGGAGDVEVELHELDEQYLALLIQPASAEGEAAATARTFAALIEQCSDFVAWHAPLDAPARINPAAARMLGGEHRADRPVSGRVRDHFEPGEWPALDEGTSAFPDRAKRWRALVHVRNRDTGEIRALDFAALPVQDDSGRLIASAGVGRDITDQRQSAARTLQRQLMITQDEERRRIAADVHDDTTQALTAVSYRLQRLRRQLNEDERALLADALDATGAALRRLRRLIFDLHPSALDSGGVAAALEQFVSVAFDEFAPIITITAEDDTLSLDRLTRVASYRATREAVINAVQHARASRVEVSVESLGEGLCLRVVDDGIGFDPTALPARPGHLGMAGARDLIEAAGGVLDLHSAPGRGTAVQVWIG